MLSKRECGGDLQAAEAIDVEDDTRMHRVQAAGWETDFGFCLR